MKKVNEMTAEEKAELRKQLLADEKIEAKKVEAKKQAYKEDVNAAIALIIPQLQDVSNELMRVKTAVFQTLLELVEDKADLFGIRSGQQSHTFTDANNNSVTIGFRMLARFDDTLETGLAYIKKYISSLATNDKSGEDMKYILTKLISRDIKGNIKPSRILELQQVADKIEDENLTKGVEIVKSSYKPLPSKIFVEAMRARYDKSTVAIPLSMTQVDFTPGANLDFAAFGIDCDWLVVDTEPVAEQKESPSEANS